MIQQIGLFPHMTVEDNVATVPRLVGWDKAAHRVRAGASCSSWSGSIPTSTRGATRTSSPAGSASASAWHGRWPPIRR